MFRDKLIESHMLFWNGVYATAFWWMAAAQKMNVKLWEIKLDKRTE